MFKLSYIFPKQEDYLKKNGQSSYAKVSEKLPENSNLITREELSETLNKITLNMEKYSSKGNPGSV